jgi:hypothetical protein
VSTQLRTHGLGVCSRVVGVQLKQLIKVHGAREHVTKPGFEDFRLAETHASHSYEMSCWRALIRSLTTCDRVAEVLVNRAFSHRRSCSAILIVTLRSSVLMSASVSSSIYVRRTLEADMAGSGPYQDSRTIDGEVSWADCEKCK